MPLDWLNTPLDADLGELLARKKRGKAIETLRRQLQGRLAPPVPVRLQLADLLMQAGRVDEAVPVLLGLADEFARDGFVAKAVAILKRVDRVQPGRADIAQRLESLVHQQKRAADLPSRPRAAVPELGIEEFGEDDAVVVAEVDLEPVEVAAEEITPLDVAPDPEPEAAAEPLLEVVETIEEELPPIAEAPLAALVEAPPAEVAAAPDLAAPSDIADAASPSPAGPGVGKRIRRALWRFLASLPGAEEGQELASEAVLPADAPVPEAAAAEERTEPAVAEAETETEVLEVHEAMSEESYRHQLLDIVEDVLHRPAPDEDTTTRDRARVLDLARRLVASRLFKDLSDEELLAIVRGLRLRTYEPGDVLVSEGEPGQSLFTLATGQVKVFVANPDGRNFQVASLVEGDFFGEISSLSGRPRTATVVAATACELLELDRPTLDAIARTHERVRDVLESSYIERASSPAAAAVRAVPLPDSGTRRKAIEVLEAHFGESRWDPRMRLRLADVLLKAGKDEDAMAILVGLADELAREGYADKAVAILKKIEQLQRRNVEVVNLAPLLRAETAPLVDAIAQRPAPDVPAQGPASRRRAATDDRFHGWLVDLVRDSVGKLQPAADGAPLAEMPAVRAYGPGLRANPLFEGLTEEELVAVIHGLKLLDFDPGDVIITEGEPGQSVFILTTGRVKVFVRGPDHRNRALATLAEASFFGEISTLSGGPRTATVTAAARCELLELDRAGLDAIHAQHPRVRAVLEAFSAARSADRDATRARGEPIAN